MRSYTRLIVINLVGLIFTLAGVVSLVALENWYAVDRRRWRSEHEVKRLALRDARGAIGYGGMIHALKNYVLRREPAYIAQFDAGAARARGAIERFRAASGVTAEELADVASIEEMVDRYEGAMRRAEGSVAGTAELDAMIRIDDRGYIRAFDRLEAGIDSRAEQMASQIEENLALGRWVGIGGGIIGGGIVLGVGSFLSLRAGRRLDRETGEKQSALDELERSRERSQFLANMSHEIRTPLNAVLGYAALAQESDQDAAAREAHLATVLRNGQYLMDLVNSVLDLSKIEAGRLGILPASTDPRELLEGVVSLVGAQAHEKRLRVRKEVDESVPGRVLVDDLRMRQVLVNLMSNAVKFTSEGEIGVRMWFERAGEGEGELRVSVRDTGIGIDPDHLETIFDSFEQADASSTRRFSGTGLGLHISRRLARMMGGDIVVRSAPGDGSEFTASFAVEVLDGPAEAERGVSRARSRGDELVGARVLVVEDGEDNLRLIEHFLRQAGAEVTSAVNGEEALEVIGESGAFDVVLMDMQMPRMDGYEATRRLRRSGYAGAIIALTAHAMSDDRERCLRVGCDEYLTKPVEREHLVGLCVRGREGRLRGEGAGA